MSNGDADNRAAQRGIVGWREELARQVQINSALYFQHAYTIVGERDAAEDICQEAFTRICQHLEVHPAAIKSWLLTTIIRLSLDFARRRAIERNALKDQGDPTLYSPDEFAKAMRQEWLLKHLSEMPERLQIVVSLRHLEGKSGAETADLLGITTGTVSKRLTDGMDWLYRVLRPEK